MYELKKTIYNDIMSYHWNIKKITKKELKEIIKEIKEIEKWIKNESKRNS